MLSEQSIIKGVKFLDTMAFKIGIFAVPMLIVLVLVGLFSFRELQRREDTRAQREAAREAGFQWEEEFRSSMIRIYQNLKLNHYLAAFRNLEGMEPSVINKSKHREEFYEALNRIAQGLLDDEFLDEAEDAFRILQEVPEYEEIARVSIARIASRRRLASARQYLERSEALIQTERYRDAKAELRRAEMEFDSVALYGFDSIDEDLKKLHSLTRKAKYEVYLQDARLYIDDARKALHGRVFSKVNEAMQFAAGNVGRAAFFQPESEEVRELREDLVEIQAELSVQVPNAIPVHNRYEEERLEQRRRFFYLEGYSFDLLKSDPDKIEIGLKYRMQVPQDEFYIVRYEVFLWDGRHFFNGHYLQASDQLAPDEKKELVFRQEIPKRLRRSPIKRVDLKVYNEKNELISRVTRAFRKTDTF